MSGRGRARGQGGRNYGGRDGGRGRGRGRGRGPRGGDSGGRGARGGRGRGPDLSGIKSVITNILPAELGANFSFYLYTVDCRDKNDKNIESRGRRAELFRRAMWENLLKNMPESEKESLRRVMFFAGSFFFSGRAIPGLEKDKMPKNLVDGSASKGDSLSIVQVQHFSAPECLQTPTPTAGPAEVLVDTFRCAGCTKSFKTEDQMIQHCTQSNGPNCRPVYPPETDGPAMLETFLNYVNTVLQRAMNERLRKWGSEFINESRAIRGKNRSGDDLGIDVFEAYSCKFGVIRRDNVQNASKARLMLTVDLRAKIMRTKNLLDVLYNIQPTDQKWSNQNQQRAKRQWIGERVMYTREKKGYTVVGLDFSKSPRTLPVPDQKISHEEYFRAKGIILSCPDHVPMVTVLGRGDKEIFLPAELVTGTELESGVREQLPIIASFRPDTRNKAIDDVRSYLIPGAQKTKNAGGLLPALGIRLEDHRMVVPAKLLGIPAIAAVGIKLQGRNAENWAPVLSKAKFNVDPNRAVHLNVVVFHNSFMDQSATTGLYNRIRNQVNNFESKYRFGDTPLALIDTGKTDGQHVAEVQKYLSTSRKPNIFVIDFVKPRSAADMAYPAVKQLLGKAGHLSQFVNLKTYNHFDPRDFRKSEMILQGVSRQILQKAGVALWWVSIPRSVPMPCVFVGVDVFHAPPMYDPKAKKRIRKPSCAAIIIQLMRSHSPTDQTVELYSQTFKQSGGQEFELEDAYKVSLQNALKAFKVAPASCIVWRDGIADSAFTGFAGDEIRGIRAGLSYPVGQGSTKDVQLAYLTCQKRIDTKILSHGIAGEHDGAHSAPPGTMVSAIQSMENQTFYINGRAPPYSTAKPVRFIVIERDDGLLNVPISELTWSQMHAYPNWTGPIKVPAVCMMAHKLAELAGGMPCSGDSIDHFRYVNRIHFL